MQSVVRVWFVVTAVFLAGGMIWAFVPILVPILGLAAGMAVLVGAIVWLARGLERLKGPPVDHPGDVS